MVLLTPFQGEFCQKEYTIYAVNENNPTKNLGGCMTTSEECPNCKARNIFRVYEPKKETETDRFITIIYDCRCPNCNKEFEILDIYDKLED